MDFVRRVTVVVPGLPFYRVVFRAGIVFLPVPSYRCLFSIDTDPVVVSPFRFVPLGADNFFLATHLRYVQQKEGKSRLYITASICGCTVSTSPNSTSSNSMLHLTMLL